jgi:hypothetical protein
MKAFFFAFLFCLFASRTFGHNVSDAYLTVEISEGAVSGQWDISLHDLDQAIGLDANKDGAVSVEEAGARQKPIIDYAFSRLSLTDGTAPILLTTKSMQFAEHSDGLYAVLKFDGHCSREAAQNLKITYSLLFEILPRHHGLFRLIVKDANTTGLFDIDTQSQEFSMAPEKNSRSKIAFIKAGIWHIWTGYDHILFLLALLFPSVVRRSEGRWQIVERLRPALVNVIKVVTAFTVAHSITLSLAATQTVYLPPQWVEVAIALSVFIAAMNNIYPLFRDSAWMVAFGFGLIHGFGFAEVLNELGLSGASLAWALVTFNFGVELGQFAIVIVFVPVAFAFRDSWFYRELSLRYGSIAIASIALLWMCERLFNFKALPF